MKTFVESFLEGNSKLEDIDDWIEKWHSSKSDLSLYEFLGLTYDEYCQWVKNSDKLLSIIQNKK